MRKEEKIEQMKETQRMSYISQFVFLFKQTPNGMLVPLNGKLSFSKNVTSNENEMRIGMRMPTKMFTKMP